MASAAVRHSDHGQWPGTMTGVSTCHPRHRSDRLVQTVCNLVNSTRYNDIFTKAHKCQLSSTVWNLDQKNSKRIEFIKSHVAVNEIRNVKILADVICGNARNWSSTPMVVFDWLLISDLTLQSAPTSYMLLECWQNHKRQEQAEKNRRTWRGIYEPL